MGRNSKSIADHTAEFTAEFTTETQRRKHSFVTTEATEVTEFLGYFFSVLSVFSVVTTFFSVSLW